MEGDSVTLNTNDTEINEDDDIEHGNLELKTLSSNQ